MPVEVPTDVVYGDVEDDAGDPRALVGRLEARCRVQTATPYRSGGAGWVAEATLADGRPAALKVGWPHPEAREEGSALAHLAWGRQCRAEGGQNSIRVHHASHLIIAM